MKKTLVVTLALVFVLGLAGTAFANPYSDVPAGHWAYKAVNDLTKAGIVEGYQGKYRGADNMTRYEMAAITARAMAKADKADAATKATIDKLAVEFSKELNDLGVRVAKLEKNQSNIKIGGESRLRYTYANDEGKAQISKLDGSNAFDWRQRLHLNAQVSENVKYTARIETTGKLDGAANSAVAFNRNFFTVSNALGIDTIQVGRFGLYQGNIMAVGKTSNNDGIQFAEKIGEFNLSGFWTEQGARTDFKGAYLAKTWDNVGINVGYLDVEASTRAAVKDAGGAIVNPAINSPKSTAVDAGVWYNFAPGWNLVGEYTTTSLDKETALEKDGKAWAAQLSYTTGKSNLKRFFSTDNIVDVSKAGEQGVAVSYRVIEKNGLPGKGQYGQFGNFGGTAVLAGVAGPATLEYANDNVKAWYYGYQNVLAKNILLNVEYQTFKAEDTGDKMGNFATAYVQFYF